MIVPIKEDRLLLNSFASEWTNESMI